MNELAKNTKDGLLVIFILITTFIISSCTLRFPTNFPRDTSIDAELYIPDFAVVLGDEWYAGDVEVATVGDDFKGRPSSLTYRAEQYVYHIDSDFPLLRYTILIYSDSQSALERYRVQDEMLFFVLPRSPYKWSDTSIGDLPNADRSHAACSRDGTSESVGRILRCKGIFLYGRNIAVLNVNPLTNNVRYFSDALVQELFQAIDNLLKN
jgi:hypothetical protein